MQTFFIVAILLLGFLITFQIAKASEYVSVLRGEEKAKKQTNKVNAFMLLAFLILGLIGVYYCNESLKGKLKSVGNTPLTYYSSYDDVLIRGRIKSIDRSTYTYYSSFEKPEYRGSLKTGSQTVIVNGIKYTIR